MRSSILLATLAGALALASASCGSSGVRVSTTTAPDANLAALHTFRVLNAPQRRAQAPALDANDPMLSNSISNQVLRNDLVQVFQQKGYAVNETSPDFLVAYYAGTKEKMDTTYWNPDPFWRYGLRGRRAAWAWPWYASGYPGIQLQTYTQGSVIIDVVDPNTRELLWRGQGVAPVSTDPPTYQTELGESVASIMQKFPNTQGAAVSQAGQ